MFCGESSCSLRALALAGLIAFTANHTQASVNPADNAANSLKNQPRLAENYGKLPLSFEANQGQSDPQVKFQSRGQGYSLFLTDQAAVLSLTKTTSSAPTKNLCHPERTGAPTDRSSSVGKGSEGPASRALSPRLTPCQTETDTLTLELSHSNPTAPEGTEALPGHANYFLGNDPAKWHTNVPTYAKVAYKNVYEGIDLIYYGNQRQLEYDFVVAPGANPKTIQLHFAGAQKLHLTPTGDLEVTAKNGQIAFHKPEIYQTLHGQRQPIQGSFTLAANHSIHFQIGHYDPTQPLVIDPTLAYSTYLGGSGANGGDYATSIAVDANGSVYVAGLAGSSDFPVIASDWQGANNNNSGGTNAFVTRLNSTGTARIYSTYLGGSGNGGMGDGANAIAIDKFGDAYVTGFTSSPGTETTCTSKSPCQFPTTPGAFQTVNKGNRVEDGSKVRAPEAFVAKLSADGSQLIYSTFVGGSGLSNVKGDIACGLALDSESNAYITGATYSKDFPTKGAIQTTNLGTPLGVSNIFVTKLNADGTGLVYSTYLGGSGVSNNKPFSGGDFGEAIAVDDNNSAYIAGYSYSGKSEKSQQSKPYPTTTGAYQTVNRAFSLYLSNAVITKLDPSGSKLSYSTYLGGSTQTQASAGDQAFGIALDAAYSAYVVGQAGSTDFPVTLGSKPPYNHNYSGFIAKLNLTGTMLTYSTILGGTTPSYAGDVATAIAVDSSFHAYVTGKAESSDFPTSSDAYLPPGNETCTDAFKYCSGNAFMTELKIDGSGQVYSTLIGGSGGKDHVGGDSGNGIAIDSAGSAYIDGKTYSSNFPGTSNYYQPQNAAQAAGNQSSTNAFIAKFGSAADYALIETATTLKTSAVTQTQGKPITFTAAVQPAIAGETPVGYIGFSIDGARPAFVLTDDKGEAQFVTYSLSPTKHTVTASYYGDVNYAGSSASVSESILGIPAAIAVVSGSNQSASYGSAYTEPLVVQVRDSLNHAVPNAVISFSGEGLKLAPASAKTDSTGKATVTATSVGTGSLTATATVSGVAKPATFSLTGTTATLTVTAKSHILKYGTPIPNPLGYTITGFVNGDTASVVSGQPVETTTATATSLPGAYPIDITVGTLAAANYTFTLKGGTITIAPLGTTGTPNFSPAAGSIASGKTVALSDSTKGAVFYYTTNGTTPTVNSTKYTGPIPVTASETIQAIAIAPGYTQSAVAKATYTVK